MGLPPVVEYNPHSLPPRRLWKYVINVPRSSAGTFCERLNLLVAERCGAATFVPDTENGRNTCRFEWNRERGGDRFGLRIGIMFVVSDAPITEMEAYVTTKDLVNSGSGEVPQFESDLLRSVSDEIVEMLKFATDLTITGPTEEWLVAFHISVPYGLGFSQSVEVANGRFKFLKTRLAPKDLTRVSALVVKCVARSAESAKQKASADAMIVLALLTLAEQRKYELTYIKWPRSRGFNNVFRAARPINEQRLFPARRYSEELEEIDPAVIQRFEDLWAAYARLQPADQVIFVPALLAYFASKNPSTNHATLSTVGYMASLAALSKPLRQRCPGQLACSIHGALNWLHDETSETNAITQTIITSCGIDDEAQRAQIKRLVNRVYREQRSAFVHSAQLRHAEYSQGAQIPPAIPSNEGPTSDLFVYQEDLTSIGNLTRRTLIEWLMGKTGCSLDRGRMQINPERVLYRTLVATSVTMAPKVMTRIATQNSINPATAQAPPNVPSS